MKEFVQSFLAAIKERAHILPLFEKLDMLKIKLVCNGEESLLVFHQGEAFLLMDNNESSVSNVISGQLDALASLLEGRDKLRNLVHMGALKVDATFRLVLLLESIFFLTKLEDQDRKIIS